MPDPLLGGMALMFGGKSQQALDLAGKANTVAEKALGRIDAHDQVCTERWGEIRGQLSEIKDILRWAVRGVIGALVAAAWFYLSHAH